MRSIEEHTEEESAQIRCLRLVTSCHKVPSGIFYAFSIIKLLGWPKSLFGFFCKILQKIYMYTNVCVYVCTYIFMYLYICMYIYL